MASVQIYARRGVCPLEQWAAVGVTEVCGTDVQSLSDCVIHALSVQSCCQRFVLGRYSLGAHRP